MPIIKRRKLKKIEIDYEHGHTAIEWHDEIVEDGAVIFTVPHRRAFSRLEKEEFKAEIPANHRARIGAVVDDIDAALPDNGGGV